VALFRRKVLAGDESRRAAHWPIMFFDPSRFHLFLSTSRSRCRSFADYVAKLAAAHVILDPARAA